MRKQTNTKASRLAAAIVDAGVTKVPEGKSGFVKLLKKRISPVTVTLTISFDKINENGTLSGATIVKIVKADGLKGVYAIAPVQGGGSIYVKLDSLEGVNVLGDMDSAAAAPIVKRKLF